MQDLLKSIEIVRAGELLLRALTNKSKRKVLRYLNSVKHANVTQVFTALRIEQSQASQYLAALYEAGVVNREKIGKHHFYSVNMEGIYKAADLCEKIIAMKRESKQNKKTANTKNQTA